MPDSRPCNGVKSIAGKGSTMKKEELIAIGVAEDQVSKILEINGKDIEHAKSVKDKELSTVTEERDDLQARLTKAEETLAKFEGIDPEKITEELQTYKKQAEDAEKNFQAQLSARDQRDWVGKKLDEYGVKSPLARKQIVAEVTAAEGGLPWKKGEFLGFDDYMKKAKEEDASLFQTAEERQKEEEEKQKAEETKKKSPIFTGPTGDPTPKGDKYVPPKIF